MHARPARDAFVRTPQGRLFARVWEADAPAAPAPILLFHDSLGSVELWRDFPRRLADATGRRVIAYDRLGFGRSDPHPSAGGSGGGAGGGALPREFIDAEAEVSVPALRAAFGIDRMIVFGHSVGGAMAVATAGAFPGATLGVVTESAQAFVEERTLRGIRAARAGFEAPGQMERLARYHGAQARWVLDAWTRTWLSPAFAGWTLDEALRRVRRPVLAIHGDRDEYGSRRHPERIAERTAGPCEVVILEGCGHVPHRERAEAVLAAVSGFVRTLDG